MTIHDPLSRPESSSSPTTPPSPLHDACVTALQNVYDPELPLSIYDLGLIYELEVDEDAGSARVLMTLTNPACPVAGTLPKEVEQALITVAGIDQASVTLTWTPTWSKDLLSPEHQLLFSTFM